jgi:hypothetical protein
MPLPQGTRLGPAMEIAESSEVSAPVAMEDR